MSNFTKIAGLSAAALIFIALWEGYSPVPYKDVVGVWTDGFGNTHDVAPGKPRTVPQDLQQLNKNISATGKALDKCIKVELTQNQYDAFVALAFNIGSERFCKSGLPQHKNLIDLLNEGDHAGACNRILAYNKGRIKGTLVPIKGLTNRRIAEHKMCLGEVT